MTTPLRSSPVLIMGWVLRWRVARSGASGHPARDRWMCAGMLPEGSRLGPPTRRRASGRAALPPIAGGLGRPVGERDRDRGVALALVTRTHSALDRDPDDALRRWHGLHDGLPD